MIRINQLKLPITHTKEELEKKIAKILRLKTTKYLSYKIFKRSIDARKKPDLFFVYIILVEVENPQKLLKIIKDKNVTLEPQRKYIYKKGECSAFSHSPIIVGCGPAGLFCAYYLAKAGLNPIIIERGEIASKRKEIVDQFWSTGTLDPNSNVQFGEGGAGTFSDGKLNTLVKDSEGRNHEVLRILVEAGAPEEITYEQKPHLGTDLLVHIVESIRKSITIMGGTFLFNTKVTDLLISEQQVKGIFLENGQLMQTEHLVLAIGHSARDTFSMLYNHNLSMKAKAFAVGLRIEHPQELININQYGSPSVEILGPAPYKLTQQLEDDRTLYSFCMCPGGYVVNASSEQGYLSVNGMSYHNRGSKNANSAMIVTVTPEDFLPYANSDTPDALTGVDFQRFLEKQCFILANGAIPVQRFEDFCANKTSTELGSVTPCIKGSYQLSNLRTALPEFICKSIEQGINQLDTKIKGFAMPDALLSGVESRTSSPVRIERFENFESSIKGIYPCGEGAGYAGGITSAAMDGLKIGETITKLSIKLLES